MTDPELLEQVFEDFGYTVHCSDENTYCYIKQYDFTTDETKEVYFDPHDVIDIAKTLNISTNELHGLLTEKGSN